MLFSTRLYGNNERLVNVSVNYYVAIISIKINQCNEKFTVSSGNPINI